MVCGNVCGNIGGDRSWSDVCNDTRDVCSDVLSCIGATTSLAKSKVINAKVTSVVIPEQRSVVIKVLK